MILTILRRSSSRPTALSRVPPGLSMSVWLVILILSELQGPISQPAIYVDISRELACPAFIRAQTAFTAKAYSERPLESYT